MLPPMPKDRFLAEERLGRLKESLLPYGSFAHNRVLARRAALLSIRLRRRTMLRDGIGSHHLAAYMYGMTIDSVRYYVKKEEGQYGT